MNNPAKLIATVKGLHKSEQPDDLTLRRCAAIVCAADRYAKFRTAAAGTRAIGNIGMLSDDYGVNGWEKPSEALSAIARGKRASSQLGPASARAAKSLRKLLGLHQSLSGDIPPSLVLDLDIVRSLLSQLDRSTQQSEQLLKTPKVDLSRKERGPTRLEIILLGMYTVVFGARAGTVADAENWALITNLLFVWKLSETEDPDVLRRRVQKLHRLFPQPTLGFYMPAEDRRLFSEAILVKNAPPPPSLRT